jgi:C4-dicarboxylate transporter, DctQ subunit
MIASLSRAYDATVASLAWLAAFGIALICLFMIVDVLVYVTGFGSIGWTSDFAAYGLLYTCLMAAPWLVREKGHVVIESMRRMTSEPTQRRLEILVSALCVLACLLLAWGGLSLVIESIQRGTIDYRAIGIPRWLLYLPLPVGFGFMAIEFARVLFGRDTLYGSGTEGI